jgi:hypothetical protein
MDIEVTVTNVTPRGPATVETRVETPLETGKCLHEVVTATDFEPLRHGESLWFVYRVTLEPDHVARKLESARARGSGEYAIIDFVDARPRPYACWEGTGPECVDTPQIPVQGLYQPISGSMPMSGAPTTPLEFELNVVHCVGADGKISQLAVLGDDPEPVLSETMLEKIAKWRFRPAIVDDRPVETCMIRTFAIERRWVVD